MYKPGVLFDIHLTASRAPSANSDLSRAECDISINSFGLLRVILCSPADSPDLSLSISIASE